MHRDRTLPRCRAWPARQWGGLGPRDGLPAPWQRPSSSTPFPRPVSPASVVHAPTVVRLATEGGIKVAWLGVTARHELSGHVFTWRAERGAVCVDDELV